MKIDGCTFPFTRAHVSHTPQPPNTILPRPLHPTPSIQHRRSISMQTTKDVFFELSDDDLTLVTGGGREDLPEVKSYRPCPKCGPVEVGKDKKCPRCGRKL